MLALAPTLLLPLLNRRTGAPVNIASSWQEVDTENKSEEGEGRNYASFVRSVKEKKLISNG
jgi:hypothetical protein